MTRYVSKPTIVEAIQWCGTYESFMACHRFCKDDSPFGSKVRVDDDGTMELLAGVNGAQGWVVVPTDHMLVKNPADNTDIWPVDPHAFSAKYDREDVGGPS